MEEVTKSNEVDNISINSEEILNKSLNDSSDSEDRTHLGDTHINKKKRIMSEEDGNWTVVNRNVKSVSYIDQCFEITVTHKEKLPKQFALARILKDNNIINVYRVKYINAYKICVIFEKEDDSNSLCNCKALLDLGWRFQRASEVNLSYGVIRNIDLGISEDQINKDISSTIKILYINRLKRKELDEWVDSETIKLCFQGSSLPPFIRIYGMQVRVDPYVFPVTQCVRCWKFGHMVKVCPAKNIVCPKCGDNHPTCDKLKVKCSNCLGNHSSMSKDCPIYLKEKKIRLIMAEFNCTFKKATTMYVPPDPPTRGLDNPSVSKDRVTNHVPESRSSTDPESNSAVNITYASVTKKKINKDPKLPLSAQKSPQRHKKKDRNQMDDLEFWNTSSDNGHNTDVEVESTKKKKKRSHQPFNNLLSKLKANDAYTRDQWYHSIVWRRNIIRYRNFLTKTVRKEVVLKELKNMVDFVMTTPLQDESVTRVPLQILTDLLSENKESSDWEEWAENATNVAAPLLAERCATGELCALLARLCRRRPRAAPLPALAPPVRRVLTRNVDFARAPNARRLVRDYISALNAHNSGPTLVRRFVEVTHGNRAACPYPRAALNLGAVALAALDDHYRDTPSPHVCSDNEEEVLCFANILEHMCKYEDWIMVVGAVLQPVPLCAGAMSCPRVANHLANVLTMLAGDSRCSAHGCVAPARAVRMYPPSWLRAAAPSDPLIALPNKQLCQLWGNMIGSLLNCCNKRKSFLQSMSKQLPDFVLVALTEHPAAIEALCLMLEWEIVSGEQTQLEIIAALQGTELGQKYYKDLCDRQKNLQRLQAEGGPRQLALPVRATDEDVAALLDEGALGNLECLSLAFTSVTSACAHHLIKLPSLRYLNLWSTKFGDTGVQLIAEHLTQLQVLNLCETPVSDKGIEALSGLSNLQRLNLNSTKLSAEAFEILRQRLPHLQEYDIRYTEAW